MITIHLYGPQHNEKSNKYEVKYLSLGASEKAADYDKNPSIKIPDDYKPESSMPIPNPAYLLDFNINIPEKADLKKDKVSRKLIIRTVIDECLATIFNSYILPEALIKKSPHFFSLQHYKSVLDVGLEHGIFDVVGLQCALQKFILLFAELASPSNLSCSIKLLSNPHVTAYSLFIVTFIDSEKNSNDIPFKNETWARLSGIIQQSLNSIEVDYYTFTGLWQIIDEPRRATRAGLQFSTTTPAQTTIQHYVRPEQTPATPKQ